MRYDFETIRGPTCFQRRDHQPDARGVIWFRHDRVFCNGQQLEGSVLSRLCRGRTGHDRVITFTCFRADMVPGRDLDWLRKQNIQVADSVLVPA